MSRRNRIDEDIHQVARHIYGFEDGPSTHSAGSGQGGPAYALVLELIDGPTLADRIAHGPTPLSEALLIAKQIIDALEAAHEHGIIHRDLKPANVKVTDDGTVKVLDFGLAKATAEDGSTPDPKSPTMTMGRTKEGVILGTACGLLPTSAITPS